MLLTSQLSLYMFVIFGCFRWFEVVLQMVFGHFQVVLRSFQLVLHYCKYPVTAHFQHDSKLASQLYQSTLLEDYLLLVPVFVPMFFKRIGITLDNLFKSNFPGQGYCHLRVSWLSIAIGRLHPSSHCVPMIFSTAYPASLLFQEDLYYYTM